MIHGDEYNYNHVQYVAVYQDIKLSCKKHGLFTITPNHHLSGRGCPKCRYTKISEKQRDTKDEFIKKSILVHGNKYDYSLVKYILSTKKIKIICKKHGVFEQTPNNHLRGHNCSNCGKTKTTEFFIKEAKLIHNNIYDYSKVIYEKDNKKVSILCNKHGEFKQTPNSHLNGSGCIKCNRNIISTEEFIKIADKKHNNKYSYLFSDYKNMKNKIIITCKNHGGFEQAPRHHLDGRGCPHCNDSKGELIIKKLLTDNHIIFTPEHKFDDCKHILSLPFDFYLPELNICIEYNGKQHYQPIKHFGGDEVFKIQQKRDRIKMEYCIKNNILLIIIKYNESIYDSLSTNLQLKIS